MTDLTRQIPYLGVYRTGAKELPTGGPTATTTGTTGTGAPLISDDYSSLFTVIKSATVACRNDWLL